MPVLRGFPAENIVAVYDEAPGGGYIDIINSPRNAPAKNPGAHLSSVYWHSEFFQYELAMPIQTVSVSHPALSVKTTTYGPTWLSGGVVVLGDVADEDHLLVSHNLGYRPLAFVAYQGRVIGSGTLVQSQSNHRSRVVSPYVTTNQVRLRGIGRSSDLSLSSASRSYQVLVCRTPAPDPALPLFGKIPSGAVTLGRGMVITSNSYLRKIAPGESPFALDIGPTTDIRDGSVRYVSGGVVTTEGGYNGSFAGPDFLQVGL